jgi:hypothetical protein
LSGSGAGPSFGTTEAGWQKMQRRKFFCAGRVNIAEEQHVFESILAPLFVSASTFESLWILEGAKEHVPQRDVREVVGVMTKLMMNPVRLRPLEKETNPRRRFDIPMIEKLSDRDQNGVITSGAHTGPKQWKQNQATQDGIN